VWSQIQEAGLWKDTKELRRLCDKMIHSSKNNNEWWWQWLFDKTLSAVK
jgi:hypothetical protein